MQTIAQQIKWNFAKDGSLQIRDGKENLIYYEQACGYWSKREYNENGNEIYYEDSKGVIDDNRPTNVVEIEGVKYKLVKL